MQIATRWGFAGKGSPLSVWDLAPELTPPEIRAERERSEEEANRIKQEMMAALFHRMEAQQGH